ncbi:MAG: esterase-like activity of phytase family protein [Oscillatoria princeps RMCB-10]|nr:esterase-like activity of phytase family protein [Oscillatoria princeps RMCB-10]
MLAACAFALLSLLTGCGAPQVALERGIAPAVERGIERAAGVGEPAPSEPPAADSGPLAADKRIFLDVSLEFLDEYLLPKMTFEETPVGGLSAIAYDRQRDRFYALSDDPSAFAPARFYTLRLSLDSEDTGRIGIKNVSIEGVTPLTAEDGQPYARNTINPEGLAFAPPNTVFVASEGVSSAGIPPFVNEFDLSTGQWRKSLPLPQRYLPDAAGSEQQRGVQNNLGFESLTLNPGGAGEPLRVFTATESPLLQDTDQPDSEQQPKNRLLHYLTSPAGDPPVLIAEHLYPMDTPPKWSIANGLTDLMVLDGGGHFLSLERSLGFLGYGARIFQVATGGATDTSAIASLKGEVKGIEPVRKKLVLNLASLGVTLDNLEGMTLGPRLPDGTQSLLLVSDNNFEEAQATQFLLFRLKKGR